MCVRCARVSACMRVCVGCRSGSQASEQNPRRNRSPAQRSVGCFANTPLPRDVSRAVFLFAAFAGMRNNRIESSAVVSALAAAALSLLGISAGTTWYLYATPHHRERKLAVWLVKRTRYATAQQRSTLAYLSTVHTHTHTLTHGLLYTYSNNYEILCWYVCARAAIQVLCDDAADAVAE